MNKINQKNATAMPSLRMAFRNPRKLLPLLCSDGFPNLSKLQHDLLEENMPHWFLSRIGHTIYGSSLASIHGTVSIKDAAHAYLLYSTQHSGFRFLHMADRARQINMRPDLPLIVSFEFADFCQCYEEQAAKAEEEEMSKSIFWASIINLRDTPRA